MRSLKRRTAGISASLCSATRRTTRSAARGAGAALGRESCIGSNTAMNTSRLRAAIGHISRAPEVLQCIRQIETWPAVMPAYVGLRSRSLPLTTRTRTGITFPPEELYAVQPLWQIYCLQVYDVRPHDRVI